MVRLESMVLGLAAATAASGAAAAASSMSSLPAFDIPSFDYAHDIPAVMHGMKMPEEMLARGVDGRRALRAWFGKMTLLPAYQRMLQDNTVLFSTHTNVTTRYLLQNNEADLKTVGCASGRRLEASEGPYLLGSGTGLPAHAHADSNYHGSPFGSTSSDPKSSGVSAPTGARSTADAVDECPNVASISSISTQARIPVSVVPIATVRTIANIGTIVAIVTIVNIGAISYSLPGNKQVVDPSAINKHVNWDIGLGPQQDEHPQNLALSPQPFYAQTHYTQKNSPAEELTEGVSTKASSARLTSSSSRLSTAERELSIAFSDADVLAIRLPIHRLNVGDEISHGAFGRVYTGVYDRQNVAIKRLSPELRNNRRQILGFLTEAKLMSTMHHERIIRFIGIAWSNPSDLMVVTEFMPGGDLRSLLKDYADRSLPTGFSQDKLRIAVHVIEGLTYMHSLQPPVLHRDLKSRNILLSDSLDACLTDFGVSRERSDVTMTMGVGTLRWMAPEVMQGGRYTDTADVFSFGVVLSELDTHQLPYSVEGRNMPDAAVITQISLGRLRVSFSPLADEEVVALARQCMALSPADRPSAEYVMSRLRQIYDHHVVVLSNQTFDV
ncbi:hypothetical protein P43SY_008049 [Pythium insidiosum]|uniref:Protein kinase domain-containing protein n=1 Tax=Pythium insidiosum TaxID=114742 RepID=A0AAD5LNN6_PYTIN|nr:hypothetical protein P43SY_008049 [Pythium insidiosum]